MDLIQYFNSRINQRKQFSKVKDQKYFRYGFQERVVRKFTGNKFLRPENFY